MKKRLLFISNKSLTKKEYYDKVEPLLNNFDVKIVELEGPKHEDPSKLPLTMNETIGFLKKNRDQFDIVQINIGLSKNFVSLIRVLKQIKLPYYIVHIKFYKSHLETFKHTFSNWYHLKRNVHLIRKYLINKINAPFVQFVSEPDSWKFDRIQLPPSSQNTVLVNHQDVDFLARKNFENRDVILFVDSYLFGNKDFRKPIIDKTEYLSHLKESLESLKQHTNKNYYLALHPKAVREHYLDYFDASNLMVFKDEPFIPSILLSEGSTLFESLIPFVHTALRYENPHLKITTRKHKAFENYANSIKQRYSVPTLTAFLNKTNEIPQSHAKHLELDLKLNSDIIFEELNTRLAST